MISTHDSKNTFKINNYYLILPHGDKKLLMHYIKKKNVKKVNNDFSYTSDGNEEFMNSSELKDTIKNLNTNDF